jgi:hypothetical protein
MKKGVGVLTYWKTPHKSQGHVSECDIKRVGVISGINTTITEAQEEYIYT